MPDGGHLCGKKGKEKMSDSLTHTQSIDGRPRKRHDDYPVGIFAIFFQNFFPCNFFIFLFLRENKSLQKLFREMTSGGFLVALTRIFFNIYFQPFFISCSSVKTSPFKNNFNIFFSSAMTARMFGKTHFRMGVWSQEFASKIRGGTILVKMKPLPTHCARARHMHIVL